MSDGRKTKEITFSLKDRGRVHTGTNRTDVDIQTWINIINSPKTQEMIATGGMLGYYGHQLRILFGLHVPETAIVGDKQISISPATRTIMMKCDQDGNVTHRQEFLDTPEGEHALQKYRAKIGGFSAVNDFTRINGTVFVTEALGFDYVLQPNYANNIGDGVLLDSVQGDIVRANAELSILEMYDSIHSGNHMRMLLDDASMQSAQLENSILEAQAEKEKRQRLQQQREEKMLDSVLCPTVDLAEYMSQGKRFMDSAVVTDMEPKKENPVKAVGGAGGWFGGLFG